MHCEFSNKTYSDLAASQARLANSIITWERKFKIAAPANVEQLSNTQTSGYPMLVPLCFSVIWGVGLFTVLETDALALRAVVIAAIVFVSIGLDRVFYRAE
jgi:hypothetical protein